MDKETRSVFVVLGPQRVRWPEPLADLLSRGLVEIEIVASVYEAAARVAGEGKSQDSRRTVRGVLIDPVSLTKRDVEALAIVTRYVPVATMLLPVPAGFESRAREAAARGTLEWEEAAVAMLALADGGERGDASTDGGGAGEGTHSAADIAARYDDMSTQALVSDAELQALLGT